MIRGHRSTFFRAGAPVLLTIVASVTARAGDPVGTAVTYQGQVKEAGVPLNGAVDVRVELFDAEVGGNPVGAPVVVTDVPVVKGLFSVELDFGSEVFNGEARWAQIDIRNPHDPANAEPFTPMAPRQLLSAAPYAVHALRPWQKQDGDLSYTEGNVGIGTKVPINRLSVAGSADFGGDVGVRRTNPAASLDVKGTGDTSPAGTPIARFERGDGSNFLDIYGDAGGNYLVADAHTTNQKNLVLQTRNNKDIVLEPHGEGKVDIRTSTGFPARVDVDGTLTITRPDISGSVAMRLDIGRLWVLRQFGSGAAGQLELASLNTSDGSISNKDFVFNTNGDVVIKGQLDIGYEIVSETTSAPSVCPAVATVSCPPGKRLLGGGCEHVGAITLPCDPITGSFPGGADNWVCHFDPGTFGGIDIRVYAICANVK